MQTSASARSAVGLWIGLLLAATSLVLAPWIFLPAPTYFLLRFGVGAPEVSAWLVLGALLALALLLPRARGRAVARAGAIGAAAALAMAVTPLVRFPATARRFSAAMRASLGPDSSGNVAPGVRAGMRPYPLIIADLFRGVPLDSASITRGIPFAAPGGVPLTLDVYRPPVRGSYPAVVQIYGGAWQRGAPGANANFAQWLATRGYVVFAIDYRHAPRWRWPAQLDDVHAALAWIGEHAAAYDADPARVAVIGRSAGGHLALMAAYTPGPLAVRAVVSFYGPADLVDAYANPPHPDPLDIRALEVALIGGTPTEMPAAYRDASPISWATHPLPPTLLIYGGRDHTVEPRYGARLRDRLVANGTTAVYLEIPWAEHAFDAVFNGPSSQLALYHTERFLAWALVAPKAGAAPVHRPN
jgi:acetyl esterase/lipase